MANPNLVASIALKSSEVADSEPHKFGAALPMSLPLPVIESMAKLVEDGLVNVVEGPVDAFVDAYHDQIADWVSPKLGDFLAELAEKFGNKPAK
jgi:ATP-dependent protease Clp ATPase subunit